MPRSGARAVARRLHALMAASLLCVVLACAAACASGESGPSDNGGNADTREPTTRLVESYRNVDLGCGWVPTGSMELSYAKRFTVDYFEGGYALACVADGNRYLIVPEGASVPTNLASDIQVVRQPVGDVYLAASDSMCLFDALGAMDRISVSGIERDDWSIPAARDAMDSGAIVYGGKYRSPDYELLLSRGVRLAVESSMINHAPEVREKLSELGIPVLVELSSYEDEPLARVEWVRLYGVLCGEDDRATDAFEEQVRQVSSVAPVGTSKTVAFFYLNGSGSAVVRRPGDYVTRMIEQAGGTYAFGNLEDATLGSSSTTMQMEQFYATAKDADVVIYNGTVGDDVTSLEELVDREPLLGRFRAFEQGNVWVTNQNMYQQMMSSGSIIAELNKVLCGTSDQLTYLRRLT